MRFERISLFDERYNELLDQEVDASKSFVSRRCSYLNWRFLKHPRNDYLAYSLSESGKVRGYIILRLKEKQACIVDIYPLTDRHVVNLLISFTIGLLTTREEDILICRCSDPVGSYLKKSGFFEREVSLQFVMHTIDSTNNLALHSASKEWALMSGDVDIG